MSYSTEEKAELEKYAKGIVDDAMLNTTRASALSVLAAGDVDIRLVKAIAAQSRGYPMGFLPEMERLTRQRFYTGESGQDWLDQGVDPVTGDPV